MSKIKIQGNASGTGVVTLTAPNTNTDRTITLPDGDISLGVGIDDNATSTAITIDASENVGIGTSSPVSLLHVHQVGTANASVIIERATGNTATLTSGASTGFTIDSDNTNGGEALTRFTQNGTEKLRIQAAGGISFNGDTAAANALDDYEEGTWTPSFSNSSITDGSYVKIGSMVYIAGKISCTGAGSSGATISGLPFAPINSSSKQGCGIVGYHNINVTEVYSILVSLGSATFSFQLASTAIECSAGANMRFNITYQTAS